MDINAEVVLESKLGVVLDMELYNYLLRRVGLEKGFQKSSYRSWQKWEEEVYRHGKELMSSVAALDREVLESETELWRLSVSRERDWNDFNN